MCRAGAPDLFDAMSGAPMLFVVSAGNDGIDNDHNPFPAVPASFDLPNVLSVAAVDNSGGIPDFSNYGATTVDIAGPGVAILSTLPADPLHPQPGYGWLDGTSMAAPHVTGVAALVASFVPSLAGEPDRSPGAPARVRQVDARDRRLDGDRPDRRCVPRARCQRPDRAAAEQRLAGQELDPGLDEGQRPCAAGRPRPTA